MSTIVKLLLVCSLTNACLGQPFIDAFMQIFTGNSGNGGDSGSGNGDTQGGQAGGSQLSSRPECPPSVRAMLESLQHSSRRKRDTASAEDSGEDSSGEEVSFEKIEQTKDDGGYSYDESSQSSPESSERLFRRRRQTMQPGTGPVTMCPSEKCETDGDCDKIQEGRVCQCGCCIQLVTDQDGRLIAIN